MKKVKKFLIEAICGFILWTFFLSPYMIWVVHVTKNQYISWVIMQCFIVPPIAIIVVNVTNWVVKKILKGNYEC